MVNNKTPSFVDENATSGCALKSVLYFIVLVLVFKLFSYIFQLVIFPSYYSRGGNLHSFFMTGFYPVFMELVIVIFVILLIILAYFFIKQLILKVCSISFIRKRISSYPPVNIARRISHMLVTVVILYIAIFTYRFHTVDKIYYASGRGDIKTVTGMLSRNPHLVNFRTNEEDTPLHFAAANSYDGILDNSLENSKETIRILLKHGASIDAKNKEGDTPLH